MDPEAVSAAVLAIIQWCFDASARRFGRRLSLWRGGQGRTSGGGFAGSAICLRFGGRFASVATRLRACGSLEGRAASVSFAVVAAPLGGTWRPRRLPLRRSGRMTLSLGSTPLIVGCLGPLSPWPLRLPLPLRLMWQRGEGSARFLGGLLPRGRPMLLPWELPRPLLRWLLSRRVWRWWLVAWLQMRQGRLRPIQHCQELRRRRWRMSILRNSDGFNARRVLGMRRIRGGVVVRLVRGRGRRLVIWPLPFLPLLLPLLPGKGGGQGRMM